MTIRFDAAWNNVIEVAHDASRSGLEVVVVRDILGRISIFVDGDTFLSVNEFSEKINRAAGNFAASKPVILASDLFDRDAVMKSPDLITISTGPSAGRLSLLERGIVGADWTRSNEPSRLRRAALYGFKGGAGRSTATFMLAQHLANLGKCVLVVDLDLESPGVSALAQDFNDLSEHGIVDFLVESTVNNTEDLDIVSRSQVIQGENNGEAWLAPAGGRNLSGYLAKLNRIYADLPGDETHQPKSFSARIDEAIRSAEDAVTALSRTPDVVLLDSRAGVHDIAAVVLTQLSSINFLFGADSPQTWTGYRILFEQWKIAGKARELGEKLQMVSSMTPDKDRENYLSSFRDHAQEAFAETLYEETDGSQLDAFNFSVDDVSAPHSPLPISFNSDLVALDPTRQPNWHSQQLIQAAFKDFLTPAADLILGYDQ